MGQIIFVNPFAKAQVTGGIKTTYNHAELLRELGFNTTVYQPHGPPQWLSPRLQALRSTKLAPTAQDILIIPETLNGIIAQIARTPMPARKVMFCQNQFYMFTYDISAETYAKLGFTHFIVPSEICKRALQTIQKVPNVSVVPLHIEPELFFPRDKTMRIVTIPRKFPDAGGLPAQAPLLRNMLGLKYPHLRAIPWELLEKKTEQEVADIMGRSTIFLALCRMEACPLAPLEAMASGCIVVGHHGIGGLEYATPENGFWFSPEQLEEVTDALATVIEGLNRGDQQLRKMREAGMATAARFTKQRTKQALERVYGEVAAGTTIGLLPSIAAQREPEREPTGPADTGAANVRDVTAFTNHGLELQKLDRLEDALAQYDKALALKPADIAALSNRGSVLIDLGRFAEALSSYDRLLLVQPNSFNALNMRGLALEQLKRFPDALESYDKAVAAAPNAVEALYNRGNVLADLGRFEEALASYDRALEIKGDAAPVLNNRGLVLEELSRFDEALANYEKALKIKPDYSAAADNHRLLLEELNRGQVSQQKQ